MEPFRLSLVVLAGIAFYVGFHHALIAWRSRRLRHLLFACLAVSLACTDVCLLIRHGTITYVEAEFWDQTQWGFELITFGLFLAFIAAFTDLRRWRGLLLVEGVLGLLLIYNYFAPYGFASNRTTGVDFKQYAWGESFPNLDHEFSLLYYFFLVLLFGGMIWALWRAWHWRHRQPREGRALLVALCLVVFAVTNNILDDFEIVDFANVIPHAFVALVVVMSLVMADEAQRVVTLEHRLEDTEGLLRATFETMIDGLIMLDEQGSVLLHNPAAERICGEHPARALAATARWSIIDDPADSTGPLDPRHYVRETHWHYRLANGQERHVALLPARTSGPLDRVVLVLRDVSNERRLQQQLAHSQKMDALGQLAGGVAHDFNNLLTGITGHAEMLAIQLASDDERRSHTERILTVAGRAADLTRQLLAFARRDSGGAKLVDLHQLLEETVSLVQRVVDKRIIIHTELAATPCTTMGEPSLIQNALLNLALNARDAMPHGGTLRFSSTTLQLEAKCIASWQLDLPPGRYIHIAVQDTGAGIPTELLPHIFEPFFTTKPTGKGTGIGLSAVFGTMVGLGGAVRVESDHEMGTCFSCYFPIHESAQPTTPHRNEPLSGKGLVLLIDDDDEVRNVLAAMLVHLGYEVIDADGGEAGISLFRQRHAELSAVLLDGIMPDRNGLEVLQVCQQLDPSVPVIIVSGHLGDTDQASFQQAGARAILAKPCLMAELAEILHDEAKRPSG